jgi:hypothetical protein
MKRVALLASGALLLVACSDGALPLAPSSVRPNALMLPKTGQEPFSETIYNPCTSEFIDFTGWISTQTAVTENGAGGFNVALHGMFNMTGIAQFTGTEYVARQEFNDELHTKTTFPGSETMVLPVRFISKGGTENLKQMLRVRFIVNGQGDVVVDFSLQEVTCR